MPKKTKKEKLLALYHKKIRSLENRSVSDIHTPTPSHKIVIVDNKTKALPINQYFFSDLKKSLILISFIIGLEIFLYFAKLNLFGT